MGEGVGGGGQGGGLGQTPGFDRTTLDPPKHYRNKTELQPNRNTNLA